MLQIMVQETIAAVWTPQVKLTKVSFQITNEALHYRFLPIITFQMHHLLTNQMLRRNHLPVYNLSLTNNHQELKITGKEISTVPPWVVKLVRFQELVLPTQTCKFYLKKVKKANSMAAQTCSHQITQYLTQRAVVKIKKFLKKGVKVLLKTLLWFKTEE